MSIPPNFAESSVLKDAMRPVSFVSGLDRFIQNRLQIWAFVVDRANERPLVGWGLDASRRIPAVPGVILLATTFPAIGNEDWEVA